MEKKKMKKAVGCLVMAVMMIATLFTGGCNSAKEEGVIKVGICNYVDDASLNQIVDNIKAELTSIGEEKNVTFKIYYDNCNADANVMAQIISNFISNKVDVMVGVATPVAMAMQAATEDTNIPVVFAAVSDPIGTELVDSLEKPGKNVTGTSDYLDTNSIMNLIFTIKPETEKVGLLYDAGQDASTTAIAQAKEYLKAKGIKVIERTGTNVSEVMLAAESLVSDGADVVFTPTDNTIMQAELSIFETFENAGILHFTGADSFALNGAFLGYGVDYIKLGKETGKMVADIAINKKNPAEMSVLMFDNGTATINTDVCEKIGLDKDEIIKKIQPLCTKVETIKTAESFN